MTPEHINTLLAAFGLGMLKTIREDAEGVLNKNYILETSTGKYFIKSVREKMKGNIAYISAVETWMHDHGVPAVCMLQTIDGQNYKEIDGHVYTVYPFLVSDRSHIYSDVDYRAMGMVLGQIHKAGMAAGIPDFLKQKAISEKKAAPIVEKLLGYKKLIEEKSDTERDATDDQFLEYINLKLSCIPKAGDGLILDNDVLGHGDYHERNLLLDPANRTIIGVCDWEKAEMMPRGYEIARSVMIIIFSHQSIGEKGLISTQAFIDGYMSCCMLTKKQLADGFALRIRSMVLSKWLEEKYYDDHDSRGNTFISQDIARIKDFFQGDMVSKIRV